MLSPRAVQKVWIPPAGVSCLPRKVRSKVPQAYQYWHAETPAKRREIRDELLKRLKEREHNMKHDAVGHGQFKLLKQTWKGQKVIREGPSRTLYHLVFKRADKFAGFALNADPIHNNSVACLPVSNANIIGTLWKTEGEVPPRSLLNTTKNTPSTISLLDQGAATVISEKNGKFIKLKFRGNKLKGLWVASQQEGSKIWDFLEEHDA